MAATTILLLEADPAAVDVFQGVLKGAGYDLVTTDDADEAFRKAAGVNLVILDMARDGRTAKEICAEVRATPAMAAIPVLCISQTDDVEARIALLEVGADDVMAKPFDARELEARVEALLLRFRRSQGLAPTTAGEPAAQDSRRMIACFSPKGGVGTTTIAVNLATALAWKRKGRVAIIDLDLQFGQVATHLNLAPRQTIAELTRDDAALNDPDLLRSYATVHESSLQVYPAPLSPELAELVTPDHVKALLETAAASYEVVVVDAGSTLDERTLSLFEAARTVIFPIQPEIAALKALHSLIDYLNESGTVSAKATFVVNHVFPREMLKMRDVESAIGSKITTELPYDPVVYLKAVNEGVPVTMGAPRSAASEQLVHLAGMIVGSPDLTAPEVRDDHRGGLLAGLRRRS